MLGEQTHVRSIREVSVLEESHRPSDFIPPQADRPARTEYGPAVLGDVLGSATRTERGAGSGAARSRQTPYTFQVIDSRRTRQAAAIDPC